MHGRRKTLIFLVPVNAEEPLPDEFVPVSVNKETTSDEEKVDFPSSRGALPTFSAAFAKNTPPSEMRFGTPRVGPRFTSPSLEPFESSTDGISVQSSVSSQPSPLRKPLSIHSTNGSGKYSRRTGSTTSNESIASVASLSSSGRSGEVQTNPFSKKFAIE